MEEGGKDGGISNPLSLARITEAGHAPRAKYKTIELTTTMQSNWPSTAVALSDSSRNTKTPSTDIVK